MINIRKTCFKELKDIYEMGNQCHVGEFLSNKSYKTHVDDFKKNNITYLSVLTLSGVLAGYIILCKGEKYGDVQLRRILIDEKHSGIGKEAIVSVENYCIKEFKSKRIWLDVYEDNFKAVYIYEKLGYIKFKGEIQGSKSILFYEKYLIL